ncbi:hypothetical protein PL10110_690006 [Planktothrix agardhii]|nr:hypothetical protein PL10110_690006 [Planktothrix agardhii]
MNHLNLLIAVNLKSIINQGLVTPESYDQLSVVTNLRILLGS